uniref:Uncharacterized protein n=1 Tax=Romanomermis culicivorax TaxID=13658 RepID=A0A915JXJ9_ROMCU
MFEYETDSDDEIENEQNSDAIPSDEKAQDEKIALGPLQLAHMVISKDFDIAQTVEECKEKMRQMNSVDNVQLAAAASIGDECSTGGFPSLRHSTTTRAIEKPIEMTFDHVPEGRDDEERKEGNRSPTPPPRRKSTYKSKTLASLTFLQMFASSILDWLLR